MAIRLIALDTAGTVELVTAEGVFSGPDHLIEITDLTVDARVERSA